MVAHQEALGRPEAVRAALIPIRKSAAWWELTPDVPWNWTSAPQGDLLVPDLDDEVRRSGAHAYILRVVLQTGQEVNAEASRSVLGESASPPRG